MLLRNAFYSWAIFALGAAICKSNIPWDVETVGSLFQRMLMKVTERQLSEERNYQVWMGIMFTPTAVPPPPTCEAPRIEMSVVCM